MAKIIIAALKITNTNIFINDKGEKEIYYPLRGR